MLIFSTIYALLIIISFLFVLSTIKYEKLHILSCSIFIFILIIALYNAILFAVSDNNLKLLSNQKHSITNAYYVNGDEEEDYIKAYLDNGTNIRLTPKDGNCKSVSISEYSGTFYFMHILPLNFTQEDVSCVE